MNEKNIGYIFPILENSLVEEKKEKVSFFKNFFKKTKKKPILKNESFLRSNFIKFDEKIKKIQSKKTIFFNLNDLNSFDKFLIDIDDKKIDRWYVFPLFFQYSENTTSKIAEIFFQNLNPEILNKLFWVKSISNHPKYINFIQKKISNVLKKSNLDEKKSIFLFFTTSFDDVKNNNLFNLEIENSYQKIIKKFPYAHYEIKYLNHKDIKEEIQNMMKNIKKRTNYIFVPLNIFDENRENENILDIFDIFKKNNINFFLLEDIYLEKEFLLNIFDIIHEKNFVTNQMLTINL
jgi:protoheme ferro-lyase